MMRSILAATLILFLGSCFNARKATKSDTEQKPKKNGAFEGMQVTLGGMTYEVNQLDSLRAKLGDSLTSHGDPSNSNAWKSIRRSSDELINKLSEYQSQIRKNPKLDIKQTDLYDDLFMHEIRTENILKSRQIKMRVPVLSEPRIDFNKRFNDLKSEELRLEFLKDLSVQVRKSDVAILRDLLKPQQ